MYLIAFGDFTTIIFIYVPSFKMRFCAVSSVCERAKYVKLDF